MDVNLQLAEESGCCVWDSALCLGEMLLKRQLLGEALGAVVAQVAAGREGPRARRGHGVRGPGGGCLGAPSDLDGDMAGNL